MNTIYSKDKINTFLLINLYFNNQFFKLKTLMFLSLRT